MEDEYPQTIEKHKDGTKGRRGVDVLAQMFGNLVNATEMTRVQGLLCAIYFMVVIE